MTRALLPPQAPLGAQIADASRQMQRLTSSQSCPVKREAKRPVRRSANRALDEGQQLVPEVSGDTVLVTGTTDTRAPPMPGVEPLAPPLPRRVTSEDHLLPLLRLIHLCKISGKQLRACCWGVHKQQPVPDLKHFFRQIIVPACAWRRSPTMAFQSSCW